ncbi:MAG: Glu-tRNA(Gln) amidotransferase subunit GatD [Thermoplasmata archaeon]|nr:MAG: Glu-tRNA(Gln) amidotransferase subunit GatD [Thermoplasmata archaeon]
MVEVEVNDLVEVEKNGKKYRGIVMPHHAFSGKNIIVIKLENGYNIGIDRRNAKIRIIKKGKRHKKLGKEIPYDEKKPSIALIGTGGTIASYVDYETGAVHPATTSEELVSAIPEIFDICNVEAKVLSQKLSENITPRDWKRMARAAAKELNKGKAGIVISHGTDTMAYSAAALAFMLKNLSGPVVFVGSQRSSDRPSSDAFDNLMGAVKVALSDIGEVVVVMHSSISSGSCFIHRATKVRKMHSSRRDAFVSVNDEPIGTVNETIKFLSHYKKKSDGKTIAKTNLNENVALVYYYPGMKEEDFENIVNGKEGIVIAGTGLGHVNEKLVRSIKKSIRNGIPVVMTTQCFYGTVNMNVYSTGRKLIKAGVIDGKDMLPEVALVKLMWVLANENDVNEAMQKNIAGEINEKRSISLSKSK